MLTRSTLSSVRGMFADRHFSGMGLDYVVDRLVFAADAAYRMEESASHVFPLVLQLLGADRIPPQALSSMHELHCVVCFAS